MQIERVNKMIFKNFTGEKIDDKISRAMPGQIT
jgi:hypothetical protein